MARFLDRAEHAVENRPIFGMCDPCETHSQVSLEISLESEQTGCDSCGYGQSRIVKIVARCPKGHLASAIELTM